MSDKEVLAQFPLVQGSGEYAPNFLEVSVSYNLGGANYFNGTTDGRGYYMHVFPVSIKNGMRSFLIGHGLKKFLVSVARKSDKSFAQAKEEAKKWQAEVIQKVLEREHLELATQEMAHV